MRGRASAGVLGGLLLLSGCGGSDDDGSEAREASCALEGAPDAQVTVVEQGDAVTVTWDGLPVPAERGFDYVVQLADADAKTLAQLTLKYWDGEPTTYAVSVDGSEYWETKVSGEPEVEGDRVVAVFPQDGPFADLEATQWNAGAYDGDLEGGACPQGERFLPFP